MNLKRLFFALDIAAPWPALPPGRIMESRHLTLAFLGQTDLDALFPHLDTFLSPLTVGAVGQFDQCLFLPPRFPRVVAWHTHFLEEISSLHNELQLWLQAHGLPFDPRPFLPHVTLARLPFDPQQWSQAFSPLPFTATSLHLYESLGYSRYTSLWHLPLLPPFEELDHTADIAFLIRATTLSSLLLHAATALSFTFPPLLSYLTPSTPDTLLDLISTLNHTIALTDQALGCPFKAVSHHGHLHQNNGLFTWEMIVDV